MGGTTTLITGATDGIGLELAKRYHLRGDRLLLLGRRPAESVFDHPSGLFQPGSYLQADLSQGEAAEQVRRQLEELGVSSIDRLIHNAGTGVYGDLQSRDSTSIEKEVLVNVVSPILLTHALLPHLRKASGQVAFVSSVATALPVPKFAVYGATKAALDGFWRSLRTELQGRVDVRLLHPGATRTGMHSKAGYQPPEAARLADPEKVAMEMEGVLDSRLPQSAIGGWNRFIQKVGPLYPAGTKVPEATGKVGGHIVITGAADGIGKALAKRYLQAGYRVTGVDRDRETAVETMNELGPGLEMLYGDLSLFEQPWMEKLAPVDIFIHNAGVNATGRFEDISSSALLEVVQVNLLAPLRVTVDLLGEGLLKPQGSLVFVNSLSRFVSYPGASVYAATKQGVAHFARSLAAEGRRVLTVYPGPTRTEHARRHSPDNRREGARMCPHKLAEAIFQARHGGRTWLIPGGVNKMAALLGVLFPKLAERVMRKLIYERFEGELGTRVG